MCSTVHLVGRLCMSLDEDVVEDEGYEYKYALNYRRECEYECGRSEGDGFSNPVELLVDDYADDEDWVVVVMVMMVLESHAIYTALPQHCARYSLNQIIPHLPRKRAMYPPQRHLPLC